MISTAAIDLTAPGKWFCDLLAIRIVDPNRIEWGRFYPVYEWFNAFEAVFWFGFCLFVAGRFALNRKTWHEILYSLSFLAFGISDMMEVNHTTLGLLAAKGIILAWIIACRKVVLNVYPLAKS
jgi:hypothetical protein